MSRNHHLQAAKLAIIERKKKLSEAVLNTTEEPVVEVAQPQSKGELRFKLKHVTTAKSDTNGNGDDVFKAVNVTAIKKFKERHGYDSAMDVSVYEDFDLSDHRQKVKHAQQIHILAHRLGDEKLKSAAKRKLQTLAKERVTALGEAFATEELLEGYESKVLAHLEDNGVNSGVFKNGKLYVDKEHKEQAIKAVNKNTDKMVPPQVYAREEVEQIDELSKKTLVNYVKRSGAEITRRTKDEGDQRKSYDALNDVAYNSSHILSKDDKNHLRAVQSTIGYKINDHQNKIEKRKDGQRVALKKLAKEGVEQIDELSKKTLGSYVNKAADSAAMSWGKRVAANKDQEEVQRFTNRLGVKDKFKTQDKINDALGAGNSEIEKHHRKAVKRLSGIGKATARLTKEETEMIKIEEASAHPRNRAKTAQEYYDDHHEDIKKTLGNIHAAIEAHKEGIKKPVMSPDGKVVPGSAGWHHMYKLKHFKRQLEDLHDSFHNGNYDSPMAATARSY